MLKPKYGEVGYRCEQSRQYKRPECKEKLCCGSAKSADTTFVIEFCQSKVLSRVKYLIPGDTEETNMVFDCINGAQNFLSSVSTIVAAFYYIS